jgi:transposase
MEHYRVTLSKEEREKLLLLIKTGKSAAYKLMHARILLALDASMEVKPQADSTIAEMLHCSVRTVQRIKERCVMEGIGAAVTRKAHTRFRPSKLQGTEEAHLISICCGLPPEGRVRWTLTLLTDKLVELNIVDDVSRSTVGRVLAANELKPWRNKEWCIPPGTNAEFVCNMEDVLDVYTRPYDAKRPVVNMDETSKQLTKETRTPIPASPGNVERYDTEYERNGVSNIFMQFEALTGKRRVKVTDRRTKNDWAIFIRELVDEDYRDAEKVVLVMDNLNTHTGASLYETFAPAEAKRILDKLEIHYTPKHGSWLNMAEIEFSHLSTQCLDRRIPDKETLIKETAAWQQQRNKCGAPVNWRFTTADARIKLKRLYPVQLNDRINDTGY